MLETAKTKDLPRQKYNTSHLSSLVFTSLLFPQLQDLCEVSPLQICQALCCVFITSNKKHAEDQMSVLQCLSGLNISSVPAALSDSECGWSDLCPLSCSGAGSSPVGTGFLSYVLPQAETGVKQSLRCLVVLLLPSMRMCIVEEVF